jgi:hypothetical protein
MTETQRSAFFALTLAGLLGLFLLQPALSFGDVDEPRGLARSVSAWLPS